MVANSKLVTSAKVSPRKLTGRYPSHVICVYTDNYTDTEEVLAAREELREQCGIKRKISYKPDVYTHVGIYRNNRWKIKETLYSM